MQLASTMPGGLLCRATTAANYTLAIDTNHRNIVVVVLIQGGWPTFGLRAAEIAGRMYRNLYDHGFFLR